MNPSQVTTYSLLRDKNDPGNYYDDIDEFGEYMLGQMEESLGPLTDRFILFINKNSIEEARPREIYLFESLMLGMFWNLYGSFAAGTSNMSIRTMSFTARLRIKGGIRRDFADILRAGLAYQLLVKKSNGILFLFPDTANLQKLVDWMQATGEFHREAKRFSNWLKFFKSENGITTFRDISISVSFASGFTIESLNTLGRYTQGVDRFVQDVKQTRRFREDKLSVIRPRGEYHLNMLGAFIYNRALRPAFLKSSEKVILLPSCMKAESASGCRAYNGTRGEMCAGCTKNCPVNQIRQMGIEYNFSVVIVAHSSDLSVTGKSDPAQTGFVGVACAATVIAGGLVLTEKGFPAQCVMLDQCGCRHWCHKAVTTHLNLSELLFRTGVIEAKEAETINHEKSGQKVIAA